MPDDELPVTKEDLVEAMSALIHGLQAARLGDADEVQNACDRMEAKPREAVHFLFGTILGMTLQFDELLGGFSDEFTFDGIIKGFAEQLMELESGEVSFEEFMDEARVTRGVELGAFVDEGPLPEDPDDWPDWLKGL